MCRRDVRPVGCLGLGRGGRAKGEGNSPVSPRGGMESQMDATSERNAVELVPASSLPLPPGPGGVPRPAGAPENLRVLDWAGFQAALTYTFDDSNSSQIAHYDALQALGVPYTFYLQTGKPESSDPIWERARDDGHELGNHTRSHNHQDPGGSDTDAATQFIQRRFGVEVWTMAAPYGSTYYRDHVAQSRFLINRGVGDASVAPNDGTSPFDVPCFVPSENASAAEFNHEVDAARALGRWLVVLVHGFTGGTDAAYRPVAFSEFAASVEHAKSSKDLWIDTAVAIGAYWRAQQLVSSATATKAGASTTWRWTLPDKFPKDQYLRVTVDGGTLTQAGRRVPWNPRGYYEIALDAGSLTSSL